MNHCIGLGINKKKDRLTAILPHDTEEVINAAGLCAACQAVQNAARQKSADGVFQFNADNKVLKEAAIELYGANRIKKSAHSRYVAKDFTKEEQAAIRAWVQSGAAPAPTQSPIGIDFPLRKQRGRSFVGDNEENAPPAPPTQRTITIGTQTVDHKHFDAQKLIEERTGVILEEDTVDCLYNLMGGEIKVDPTSNDFDAAIGKLARVRAANKAKELTFITNFPPKKDALALLTLSLINAVWIFQTEERMEMFNESFAGPDTKEFVAKYNGD